MALDLMVGNLNKHPSKKLCFPQWFSYSVGVTLIKIESLRLVNYKTMVYLTVFSVPVNDKEKA